MADPRPSVLLQGVVAGLIGYASLAALMSAFDLATGRSPFHSASVLGATLFYGVRNPSAIEVLPEYVLSYNGAHLLVFLLMGVIGAALAVLADRGRQLWYLSAFLYVFVAFHAMGAVQALSEETRGALSTNAIWIGGSVAGLLMAAYLIRMHPRMRRPQRWDD